MKSKDWIYAAYFLCAALLPIGNTVFTWCIGITALCWIVNANWQEKRINLQGSYWLALLFTFYAFTAIGFIYSEDKHEAMFKLQQKIALVLLPLFFVSVPIIKEKLLRVLMTAFVVGCLFVIARNNIFSIIDYSTSHSYSEFFYSRFADTIHPTYLALIFNIAAAYCLKAIIDEKEDSKLGHWFYYAALPLILVGIIQCASKAGMLSLGILITTIVFYCLRGKIVPVAKKLAYFGSVVIFFAGTYYISLNFQQRMARMVSFITKENKMADKTSSESNQVRVLVWTSAWGLIKQSPLTGYGTGDVNAVLKEENLKNGYTAAVKENLNAHNQYLQVMLSNGIGAFLAFISVLLILSYKAVRKNNFLGYCFLALIVFNFLFESMLETRMGIAVFAFFAGLFFCYMEPANLQAKQKPTTA